MSGPPETFYGRSGSKQRGYLKIRSGKSHRINLQRFHFEHFQWQEFNSHPTNTNSPRHLIPIWFVKCPRHQRRWYASTKKHTQVKVKQKRVPTTASRAMTLVADEWDPCILKGTLDTLTVANSPLNVRTQSYFNYWSFSGIKLHNRICHNLP